jgi:hypothetical protein
MAKSFTDYQLEQFAEQLQGIETTYTHGSFSDKEIAKEELLTLAEGNMKRLVAELQGLRELFQAATTPVPERELELLSDSTLYWRRAARNSTSACDQIFCLIEAFNHLTGQLYGQHDRNEKRVQELVAEVAALKQAAYPETLTPHLAVVLGWPNYKCGQFAPIFRRAGHDIPHKAEREQAFVLHWLTKLVLQHGEKWAEHGDQEIKTMIRAQRVAVGGVLGLLQNGVR